jgi:hypothetical protein
MPNRNPKTIANPFRPGAGHTPPYLAGRESQIAEFQRLLKQDVILENMVLTGLRGVGKTVLLDTFRPEAIQAGWGWVGDNISQSTTASEERIAIRIMTDLAVVTSFIVIEEQESIGIGFRPEKHCVKHTFDFELMLDLYRKTPGLVSDKLKIVLESAWRCMRHQFRRGLVFAYDESQNLMDHANTNEYPLSLLLDVFQSIQKKNIPFLLVLVGLPTVYPKLVGARTFSERMFRVVFLDRLNEEDSRNAILKPIRQLPLNSKWTKLWEHLTSSIVANSGGYPYFIQFICREMFDMMEQAVLQDADQVCLPIGAILRKLDTDFFAGRWARATDRQRELLSVAARLETADEEFTVQEIVDKSMSLSKKPFRASHVSQMLAALCNAELVYKNRHGKYSFAVPLLGRFILRQQQS